MPSAWVACSQYLAVTAVEPLTSKRDFLGWEPAFETSCVEHEQVSDVGSREGARVWPILGRIDKGRREPKEGNCLEVSFTDETIASQIIMLLAFLHALPRSSALS